MNEMHGLTLPTAGVTSATVTEHNVDQIKGACQAQTAVYNNAIATSLRYQ